MSLCLTLGGQWLERCPGTLIQAFDTLTCLHFQEPWTVGSPSFRPSLPHLAGYVVKICLPLNGEVKIPIQTLVTRTESSSSAFPVPSASSC